MSESILTRTTRIARFLFKSGTIANVAPGALPAAAPVVLRHGLNVRTIHHVHALNHPERVALRDDRRALTYVEANAAINRIARGLSAAGIKRGDRLVICLENRVEYILFWFAGFRSGVAIVHASYRSTSDELSYLAAHSRARGIVCSAKTADVVGEVVESMPNLKVVALDGAEVSGGQLDYPEFAAGEIAEFFEPPVQAAGDNVVYTSGTTGKPKGAMRKFADIGIIELSRIGDKLPVEAGDRHLVVSPLYHSGAQAFVGLATSLGCTIHIRGHFEAEDTLRYLSRWHIHHLFMVPTMIRRIVELDEKVLAANPTPDLRAVVSGAAAFPHSLRLRAIELFGADKIYDFYGATELGWITLIDGREMLDKPGSVGRPLSGHEIEIVDEDGKDVPEGEIGRIWARNDQTMEGYLDEEAPESDRPEGWVTVEDLGYLDHDGYLFLAGRERDMVISGGMNIYPVEIEEVLAHCPGVEEVAVIGVDDPEWGEKLVAVVVGDADPEDLEERARQKLAGYKVPREWVFTDDLPRNPTGKVLKRQLREQFE